MAGPPGLASPSSRASGRNCSFAPIGLMRRRLEGHAHDIDVVLPVVWRLRALTDPSEDLIEGDSMIVLAVAYEGTKLVDRLRAGSDLPGLRELNEWRAAARGCVRALHEMDSAWLAEYAAQLPQKDQRLLRSM